MISPFLTHPIGPPRRSVASDPQRERLYKLEREIIGTNIYHVVSRKNLQTIADHVCRYYKIAAIKIKVVNQPEVRDMGWCESTTYVDNPEGVPLDCSITLNRGFHGANVSILIHELAHYVAEMMYKNIESHGSAFMGIYMHLLAKYRIFPMDCFKLLAARHGIKIDPYYTPAHMYA